MAQLEISTGKFEKVLGRVLVRDGVGTHGDRHEEQCQVAFTHMLGWMLVGDSSIELLDETPVKDD